MSEQLTVINPGELVRQASDVAGVCKEIVTRTALEIQGRKFVRVEGWQSIATAHGCVAGATNVERVEGGFRAIGELRRMSDGAILATAEGFVGEDETTWFGGEQHTKNGSRTLPKRPDYAIRAMAQTRAISRVCRSAFAHVVVLMDAGLSTTPAEEVPDGGFQEEERRPIKPLSAFAGARKQAPAKIVEPTDEPGTWRDVKIHFGKNNGVPLGELNSKQLEWYATDWVQKKTEDSRQPSADDVKLVDALMAYQRECKNGMQTVKAAVEEEDQVPF